MITCKTFGNVYADAILHQKHWGTKPAVLLSLVGSESTVKGASAAFLESHTLFFGEDSELSIRRDSQFGSYRSKTRKLAPHITHTLIYPIDFSSHIVVGRDECELKRRLTQKVMESIPFLHQWSEWLWKWVQETNSFQPLDGHNILGGWVNINYETLKGAISESISSLRQIL
jgi:hypothetical protein